MAMPATNPLSIPSPDQPVMVQSPDATPEDPGTPRTSQVWWRFWQALQQRATQGAPANVALALTAEGTVQGDALPLTSDWNEVTTTPLNSGVLLQDSGNGLTSIVWNGGANGLLVYPPDGVQIDALAVNAGYLLATGKAQIFCQLSDTLIRSLQLG